MSSVPVVLLLTVLALGYVSLLLYYRLASQGWPMRRVYGVIAEVWLVFALIVGAFWLTTLLIPAAPAVSLAAEFAARLRVIGSLPLAQQALLIGLFVAALASLIHLLLSLRIAFRDAPIVPPKDGEIQP